MKKNTALAVVSSVTIAANTIVAIVSTVMISKLTTNNAKKHR
ncbi:MAG: hypothetical protein ABF679_08735 [Lentilactobacillus diolivorans]|jgi:hypothetical protein|nr:hypothetical protein [Lentilactobacillus diolivorans]MDH5105461.1 hypothetical protein [Lentilactobacillus diolivorans]